MRATVSFSTCFLIIIIIFSLLLLLLLFSFSSLFYNSLSFNSSKEGEIDRDYSKFRLARASKIRREFRVFRSARVKAPSN